MFRNKKVLITGGMGFIGSNLAMRLVRENADVTLLDSMLEEYGANLFNIEDIKDMVRVNFSDMRDEHSLKYLVKGKDYIFNMVGQVSHQDSMTKPFMDLEINTKAQLTLLECCRYNAPNAVIIFAGTRQIYGKPQYLPVDELHPLLPPDVNGINKLAAEYYHRLYTHVYNIKTVCLRLTNTYGPRQLIKNARHGVIGWFINRAITGSVIKLFGSGEQIRDFTYVDDVVDAMCKVAINENAYGKVFNLSGDCGTLRQVAEILIENVGKGQIEIVPFPAERKKIDIGDFYGNSDKLQQTIGWKWNISIQEGLKQVIEYYIQNSKYYL